MFQETLRRLDGIRDASPPIIVCNEVHRFLVAEHARQIGTSLQSIILEPAGRNTAPALTLATLALADFSRGSPDEDPVMLVMPSDHLIRDVQAFQAVVEHGAVLAANGHLATFGILPDAAQTGYGYIKKGRPIAPDRTGPAKAFSVSAFVEKPDEATAVRMVESESYLWNSGIFMMRVSVWLEQLQLHRPDISEACRAAHERGREDGEFYRPDPDLFANCPSDSIDYAVMERMAGADGPSAASAQVQGAEAVVDGAPHVVLPLDAGWSDLGSWSAVLEAGNPDPQGNVVQGDIQSHSMRNSLLIGQHRLVTAVGLDDVIVVETADAVLVAHKDRVQDVKEIVAQLTAESRPEHEDHRKVHRPWGSYETVDAGPRFQVKRLTVMPGSSLSLQVHHHRAEHWIVVTGTAKVTRGNEEFLLTENQSTNVPVGTKHRLENPGTIPLEIIEVQSGSYLGEDDITRFDDRYGRHQE